ncbi:MAG: esterase-like activity of phytase family protein [Rhizomicrobium sp.]
MTIATPRVAARRFCLAVLAAALLGSGAHATSTAVLTPNTSNPTSVSFMGQTFVNQGMVGAGRLSSLLHDARGDSLGSFSSLAILGNGWHRNADGTYGGTLLVQPDRGYNVGTVYSDFAARTNALGFTFAPHNDTGNLPQSPNSQNQLQFTVGGALVYTDFNGQETTGANPWTGTKTENGIILPSPVTGTLGAGKVAIDAESLSFLHDGSFYVGDEYGANVYYFNPLGQMQGVIKAPFSAQPHDALGNLVYGVDPVSSGDLNTTGRRANQGFEGMSVTPDGKQLFALMQSADLQDSTSSAQNRNNTRLYIYDISASRTPSAPTAEYVLQLPVYRTTGNGAAANATAAQSEILALNGSQFLMLTRDGNGLGKEDGNPLVFKSIYLVDTAGATNIAGSNYDTTNTTINTGFGANGGVLNPAITPVQSTELVNLINPTQLARNGFTTSLTPPNQTVPTNRISEKWEGMALVPVLEENAPQDFFLFVSNDNDFLTPSGCVMPGVVNCNSAVENDNMVLVWRLTLPTYVDPNFLASMEETAPDLYTAVGAVASGGATTAGRAIATHLDAARTLEAGQVHEAGLGPDAVLWISGDYAAIDMNGISGNPGGVTAGIDLKPFDTLTAGAALNYHSGGSDVQGGYSFDQTAYGVSVYAGYIEGGLFANLSDTYERQEFGSILRPAAYGLIGTGKTHGYTNDLHFEAGWMLGDASLNFGPVGGFDWIYGELDSYTETAAAGGDVIFPRAIYHAFGGFAGGEASLPLEPGLVSTFRATYNFDGSVLGNSATFRLASAQQVLATQVLALPDRSQDHVDLSLRLAASQVAGPLDLSLNYTAQIGVNNGTNHLIALDAGLHL